MSVNFLCKIESTRVISTILLDNKIIHELHLIITTDRRDFCVWSGSILCHFAVWSTSIRHSLVYSLRSLTTKNAGSTFKWSTVKCKCCGLTSSLPECLMKFCKVTLTLVSVDETLWCNHSNETSSAVLSHGTIYLVCSSNFRVCRWNPMVLPFKWNLFSSTFTWYYLFSM